jgi:phosphatidate cytidylyltransferase
MLAVMVLSLLCFREYARATGLFREKTICAVVGLGIVLVTFAAIDHWQDDALFFAMGPLVGALIVIVSIPADRPRGFIQRVALGVLGFALLGFSLGYISNMANVVDLGGTGTDYRPLVLLLIVAVELNDMLAALIGRTLGRRPLLKNTNPRKTWAGAIGAAVLTTAMVVAAGGWLFQGTPVASTGWLIGLGLLVSLLGLLGDLTLASIKRDVGVEDVGATLPGHGGLLDRFDGLVLVPPAVYHYLSLALGDSGPLGSEGPHRILTSGWGG